MVALWFVIALIVVLAFVYFRKVQRCWLPLAALACPRFLETESNFDGVKADLVSELMENVLECIDAWM